MTSLRQIHMYEILEASDARLNAPCIFPSVIPRTCIIPHCIRTVTLSNYPPDSPLALAEPSGKSSVTRAVGLAIVGGRNSPGEIGRTVDEKSLALVHRPSR